MGSAAGLPDAGTYEAWFYFHGEFPQLAVRRARGEAPRFGVPVYRRCDWDHARIAALHVYLRDHPPDDPFLDEWRFTFTGTVVRRGWGLRLVEMGAVRDVRPARGFFGLVL